MEHASSHINRSNMTRAQITFTLGCTITMAIHINILLLALNCCRTALHALNWNPLSNGICPGDWFRTLWRLGGLWRHCYHCWVNAIQRWSKWSGENHCIQYSLSSHIMPAEHSLQVLCCPDLDRSVAAQNVSHFSNPESTVNDGTLCLP